MPMFTADATRRDPYKTMKFRVFVEGDVEPFYASKVSPLKRTIAPIEFRVGGDLSAPRVMPGNAKYEPVTIDIPLTHDNRPAAFAALLGRPDALPGGERHMSLSTYRKTVIIQVLNEAGQPAVGYKLSECWVSDFQALPELDANSPAVAVQQIVLQYQGFVSLELPEPTPTF